MCIVALLPHKKKEYNRKNSCRIKIQNTYNFLTFAELKSTQPVSTTAAHCRKMAAIPEIEHHNFRSFVLVSQETFFSRRRCRLGKVSFLETTTARHYYFLTLKYC